MDDPVLQRMAAGDRTPAADPLRRGRRLEMLTVGWNLLEALVALTASAAAGSSALLGFGMDSLVESASGGAMLWRLREGEPGERRERAAQILVGGSLLALAAWVAVDAGWSLAARRVPDDSPVGIVLAAVSLLVMPLLARAKRRVARELSSAAMEADSKQTDICAWLSGLLLAGLALNAWAGWWWADPVAALAMVPLIAWEGTRAIRGRVACSCP